jgi:hypothetical protein
MKDLLSWGTYRHIKDQGDAPRFNTVNGANEETREVGAHRNRDRTAAAEAERRFRFRVVWRPREREN